MQEKDEKTKERSRTSVVKPDSIDALGCRVLGRSVPSSDASYTDTSTQ